MMSTTEERYGRATRSSHLKMEDNAAGDIDTLAAAGMSNTLGARLLRLRSEYDSVRRAQFVMLEHHSQALQDAHQARVASHTSAEDLREAFEAHRAEAEREALTARLLILIELKSLQPAKQALGIHALQLSQRRQLQLEAEEVFLIVGSVLDAWLDRLCTKCQGRGFNGGYSGGPVIRCNACRGTGNRRLGMFAERIDGQALGEKLIAVMDNSVAACERKIQTLLRG